MPRSTRSAAPPSPVAALLARSSSARRPQPKRVTRRGRPAGSTGTRTRESILDAAERSAPDRTYSTQGCFIADYEFDRERYRISGSVYRSADLAHRLALDIASRSLDDALFTSGEGLPKETTGVFLGNTLTGEFSRANILRLRYPYVRRVVESVLHEQDACVDKIPNILARLEEIYKEPFPPIGEESLAG